MMFIWQKVYSVSMACNQRSSRPLIFERFKLFAVRVCLAIIRLGSIQGGILCYLYICNVKDTVRCIKAIMIIPFVS